MIIINEQETLSHDDRLAALAHIYLELQLSLPGAMKAAAADLVHLDGIELLAEAV